MLRNRKSARKLRFAGLGLALGLGIAAIAPAAANATELGGVTGNIQCRAFPNTAIGTSATARGRITFELKMYKSTSSLGLVEMGSSSAYAPWGWKWWSMQAGNFVVVAFGGKGDVKGASRYCQNMFT